MFERDIVILANSLRMGGHCLAGKDLHTGEWIRPINTINPKRPDPSAFRNYDLLKLYGNESGPQLFDCVRIGFKKKCPTKCQPENFFIDQNPWKPLEPFQRDKIPELVDEPPFMWLGQKDTMSPAPDRISQERVNKQPIDSSLIFMKLEPSKNEMKFIPDTDYHHRSRKRMQFLYGGKRYSLVVKDIHHLNPLEKGIKEKPVPECYVTIGLTELHKETNGHYKLIVGLIPSRLVKK